MRAHHAHHALTLAAAAILSTSASAQAPLYIDLSPGSTPTDVTVTSTDVVVVGRDSAGNAFRWTYSSLTENSLGPVSGGNVKVSADGNVVASTVTDPFGIDKAARYAAGTWTLGPGLGATSGTSETTGYAISGDGQTVVGLGWIIGGHAHCYAWNQTTGQHDYGGLFSDPSSRANCVNGDGSVIAGWKDLLNGTRQGARWVNGVIQPQLTWTDPSTMIPYKLGEAQGVNASGTTIVGGGNFANPVPPALLYAAWRFDSTTGLTTLLPNLAGNTSNAQALDASNDGTRIVGHTGGNQISGTNAILWINNTPNKLRDYLVALGSLGVSAYPDLGIAYAISDDGLAICGRGTGFGLGQPAGGWVVIFPGALHVGTPYCFGDGSSTACPCGNSGGTGRGCANSVNATGALLSATGAASLSADSVILYGAGMPNSSVLYFQGTTQQNGGLGGVFGDGLRCAAGSVIRLGTKSNSAGGSQYPIGADPLISVRGLISTSGTRTYQVWYRNSAAFCTSATYNLSNGIEIAWTP